MSIERILFYLLCVCGLLSIIYYLVLQNDGSNLVNDIPERSITENIKQKVKDETVYIAVVACGDRFGEAMNMIKSAILFSLGMPLYFIVVAEDTIIPDFNEKLTEWQAISNNSFQYRVTKLAFPTQNSEEWKKLFKPCAAQRLFLPSLLLDIDSVLYVDTDTLFLAPPQLIWSMFKSFNSTQLAALCPEHEDANVGWYNRFARHPYYGPMGVNSGVMLMNLTRMRSFKWTQYVLPIHKKYKMRITWGDQDIINILFHYHPDKLFIFPCLFNYRSDHCAYMSVCKPKNKKVLSETDNNKRFSYENNEGVVVLHGSRGYFHSNKQPAFKAVYTAMQEYQINLDPYRNFLRVVETYIEYTKDTNCGQVQDILLANSRKYIKNNDLL